VSELKRVYSRIDMDPLVVKAQDDLMKARDERVALMNEVGCLRRLVLFAHQGFRFWEASACSSLWPGRGASNDA
jgi:hypothetical protein